MPQSLLFTIYLFLFLHLIVINAEENHDSNYTEQQGLNDDELHTIVYTYYVVGSLNAIACSFIFCKTFMKFLHCKRNRNNLTMSYRLPFYTAIADFGIFISGAVNITHTAIYAKVWEQPMCTIMGILTWFFISLNLSLYGVISIMTYIRVCREICIDTGRYDYKLWLIILSIIIALQVLAGPFYGPGKYWCIGKSKTIALSVTNFVLCLILLLIILACYILIYQTIGATFSDDGDDENNNNNNKYVTISNTRCQMERKASFKISCYILVFFIQWTPVQIYNIGSWCHIDKPWIYVLAVIGINLGGIGNAIQYIFNERKTFHLTQHKSSLEHFKTRINNESCPTSNSTLTIELHDLPVKIIVENNENDVENNEIVDD